MNTVIVDFVITLLANVVSSFLITYYLINTLGYMEGCKKWQVYTINSVVVFACMEILTLVNMFEIINVIVLFAVVLGLSIKLFNKSINKKLLHCLIAILFVVFVKMLVGSIITMFIIANNIGDNEIINVVLRYVGLIIGQVVLYLALRFEIKQVEYNEKGINALYSILAMSLASLSVFTVAMLQQVIMAKGSDLLYGGIASVGVILLVVVSLIVYGIGERTYAEKLKNELMLEVYKRREFDINQLNNTMYQIEKVRHEFNKVCVTTKELMADGKYAEAEEFLGKFYDEEIKRIQKVNYTDNVIMNYILNQKMDMCSELGVDVKYIINGSVEGIDDVDLHCILTNLWDNAIEAVKDLKDKEISCYVFADEDCVNIEMSNTVRSDLMWMDWDTKTSKTDSSGHGYGMANIKNVVEKYKGVCQYERCGAERITCKILLIKEFTTNNRDSRQDN